MTKIGRVHAVRLVLALCVVLASGSVAASSAGALGGLTGPIGEKAVGPVHEVVETVTSPVQEVTETSGPVQEATETVPPPVSAPPVKAPPVVPSPPAAKEVTETVTHPAKETIEAVTQPAKEAAGPPAKQAAGTVAASPAPIKGKTVGHAVDAASGKAGSSSGDVAKNPATAAGDATAAGATQTAQSTVGNVTHVVRAGTNPGDGDGSPTSVQGGPANGTIAPSGARPADRTAHSADRALEVPSSGGAIQTPLPRLMAYVWPAIALTRPALADLLGRWEQAGLRLMIGTEGVGAGSGRGPLQAVAGVQASGGRPAPDASASSPSFLSKVGSAVGDPSADVSTSVLTYLCLLAFAGIAVAVAVRREIAIGRRRRSR